MVSFDPSTRYTCLQALEHPWLSSYHDETDEPNCPQVFDRWRELEKLEIVEDYRNALISEIEEYRREVRAAPTVSDNDGRSSSVDGVSMDDEDQEMDELMPMGMSTDMRPESHEVRRKGSRGSELMHSPAEAIAASAGTDPVVAYARRSSIFQPSRTNSTYSAHRVAPSDETASDIQSQGSSVAFPSGAAPEYVVPARARTASMAGHSAWPSEGGRRRLLRTLSTVSVYETGEGREDVAPIAKLIGEKDRTGEDPLKSGLPKELGGVASSGSSEQMISKVKGSEGDTGEDNAEKKRRFIID